MTTPRTLLAHEDRFAIQDLIALYGHTLDSGDVDSWIGLFMPDAVYALPTQVLEGQVAIREWIEGLLAMRDSAMQPRHHTTNTLLLPESEDRVLGRSMLFMTSQPRAVGTKAVVPARAAEEDRASLTMAGLYGDIYTRTADGWRFQSRRADVDFSLDPRFLQLA